MSVLRCPDCHREFEQGFLKCPYDGATLIDPTAAALDPFIGKELGGTYQIVRKLGAGGMGAVYEARHLRLDTSFAVKLLHPQLAISDELLARFHREARSASQLRHPNIIEVMDVNQTEDHVHYIVQEYLDGEPLSDLLERERVLSLEQGVPIVTAVCDAMAAAHDRSIVHRDLKPENIFLTQRGGVSRVKVLDFGIAKMQETNTKLTRASTAMGTPDYISPEQACSADVADYRSDIYSLGVVIYRIFTGRLPYEITSAALALEAVRVKDPVRPRERKPDLPEEVEQVILLAMERSPDDRFQSMTALKSALLSLLEQSRAQQITVPDDLRDGVPRTMMSDPTPTPGPVSPTPAPMAAPPDGGGVTPLPAGQVQPTTAHQAHKASRAPLWVMMALLVMGGGAGGTYLLLKQPGAKGSPRLDGGAEAAKGAVVDAAVPDTAPTIPEGMVAVVGGSFQMGRNDGHRWERPAHRCEVKDFYLDSDEVTQGEFLSFIEGEGAALRAKAAWKLFKPSDAKLPVTNVTWAEALRYCESLGKRLPSEAEWEYAARGRGHESLYPGGNQVPPPAVAHFSRKAKLKGPRQRGEAVAGFADLSGNAAEWVQDTFGLYTQQCGQRKLLSKKLKGYRVIRGGGYDDTSPKRLTATWRIPQEPKRFRWKSVGFRCARDKE